MLSNAKHSKQNIVNTEHPLSNFEKQFCFTNKVDQVL